MVEPTVYTTIDKAKRDELFAALRSNGDKWEKQVVKFSGVEVIPGEFDSKGRPKYRSTWSVSHPTDPRSI